MKLYGDKEIPNKYFQWTLSMLGSESI